MGFDIQLTDVTEKDLPDLLDREVDALRRGPELSKENVELARYLVSAVKDVVGALTTDDKSKVYVAITGEAGRTAEGEMNWLNISITETERGTNKKAARSETIAAPAETNPAENETPAEDPAPV